MKKLLRKLGFQEFATLDWAAWPDAEPFENGTGPYVVTFPGGGIVVDKTGIRAEQWTKSGETFAACAITNLYAARAWLLTMARYRNWKPAYAYVASWPGAKPDGEEDEPVNGWMLSK